MLVDCVAKMSNCGTYRLIDVNLAKIFSRELRTQTGEETPTEEENGFLFRKGEGLKSKNSGWEGRAEGQRGLIQIKKEVEAFRRKWEG